MALSDSQMRKPVLVARSSLYFRQWQYVLLLILPEASFLRVLKHVRIDESISYRNEWLTRYRRTDTVSTETRENLHLACDYLLTRKHPYKKVVCGNGLWLYTNNIEDFEDIDTIPTGEILYINQAQVTLTDGAVILKNPQHEYRTYFKERWLSNDELKAMRRYFTTRGDMFRQGPGFAKVVSGHRMWLMNNHFVDHNEPNADFLINMAVPGIVRKTLPIVARAK